MTFKKIFIFAIILFILPMMACSPDEKKSFEEADTGVLEDVDTGVLEETKSLTDIEISQLPEKTSYLMGELLDLTGLKVENVYDDGSRAETNDYEIHFDGNMFASGTRSVTVISTENEGLVRSFEIEVTSQLINTGLPVIYVETEDAQPIVSKTEYLKMNFRIVAETSDHSLEKTGFKDQIRGRGNSSWGLPQKPYRIKFDKKTSLFGYEAAKSWVLLATYNDSTLLMNTVAFELGRRFEFPYTNHTTHVEVVINNHYQGSYVLTEHVQVGKGRVDIDEDNGFLVELDENYDDEPKFMTTNLNLPVMIKSPEDLEDPAGYDFVKDALNALDAAMSDQAFPNNDYADLINVDTFVDYIMINEITFNREINHPMSVYLHRDGLIDSKMNLGPIWDFDHGYGSLGNDSVDLTTAKERFEGGQYFSRFFRDPVFKEKYKAHWNERYHDSIATMPEFIEEMSQKLKQSQMLRNRRWYSSDYEFEIDKMKTWWSERVNYLNGSINSD